MDAVNPLVVWWKNQRRRRIPCSALIMVFMTVGVILYGTDPYDHGLVIPRERLVEYGFHPDALKKFRPQVDCFEPVVTPKMTLHNPQRVNNMAEKGWGWALEPENGDMFWIVVPGDGQINEYGYTARTYIWDEPKIGERLCLFQLPDPNHGQWLTIVSNSPDFFRDR